MEYNQYFYHNNGANECIVTGVPHCDEPTEDYHLSLQLHGPLASCSSLFGFLLVSLDDNMSVLCFDVHHVYAAFQAPHREHRDMMSFSQDDD